MKFKLKKAIEVLSFFLIFTIFQLSAEPESKAPNHTTVGNTRHNMTQSYLGSGANWMNYSRNNYGEVCVYCHTPHGANTQLSAPLWNRTFKANTYTTYGSNNSATLQSAVTDPGVNSLTCLSCHDGTTAIDSIINMPGSGRYNKGQETAQLNSFLDSWPGGPGSTMWGGHGTLEVSDDAFNQYGSCQSCHSVDGMQYDPSSIPAFDVVYISTDLTNDHPIGVVYPGPGDEFNDANKTKGNMRYFDRNDDDRLDSDEPRFYDSGDSFEVECASCHDPHGVPLNGSGNGGQFTSSFLRLSNDNSALCLTCHIK